MCKCQGLTCRPLAQKEWEGKGENEKVKKGRKERQRGREKKEKGRKRDEKGKKGKRNEGKRKKTEENGKEVKLARKLVFTLSGVFYLFGGAYVTLLFVAIGQGAH